MNKSSLKIAESLRGRMMKGSKYLISRIEDSGQEAGNKRVIDAYFRYKDYIKNPEWLTASIQEVWSPKFLGLVGDVSSVDIRKIKRLEFQNPAYSAAFRLSKDPRDFNRVFVVQVSGCDFDCNYCYVPRDINIANPDLGKYFSGKEIVANFIKTREESKEPLNVIRVTGGNPTIIPEIIIDVYREIKSQKLDIYLWIDSNLSTAEFLTKAGKELIDLLHEKNVGVVGCFKGVCAENFSILTGSSSEYYDLQFETAKWFIDNDTDFYVYLPALIYGENVEDKLNIFIEKLRAIDFNLPLRVEILEIIDYPGSKLNQERTRRVRRPLPINDQRIVFDLWYNKLLPRFYSKEELDKYCSEVSLVK